MFCTFGLHTYIIPTGFALVFTVFKSTAVNGLRLTIVKRGEKNCKSVCLKILLMLIVLELTILPTWKMYERKSCKSIWLLILLQAGMKRDSEDDQRI